MSNDLFDKFDSLIAAKAMLPVDKADPFKVCMDEVLSPTEAIIDGRRTILAGTNNYMGMTFDAETMQAAIEAVENYGTGTTGSRVLNGTYSGHEELEKTIAEFYGMEFAIVFSTGYLANLGVISTLAGRDDYVLIDADSHASIYDGCSLGNANIVRFKHNDPDALARRLKRLPDDAGKLVIIEGIYSMLGDAAPIKEFVDVKNEFGATLLVDEAHSMGFCGATGRGVAQAEGVEDDVDLIIGTFSKSVGTVGGFCVSNHPKAEILRLAARPYMFTASLPPSVVASAKRSIELIAGADDKREKLWSNARRLHAGLKKAGFTLGTEKAESPIVAVCLPTMEGAAEFWAGLLLAGVYTNMAIPPATPNGLNLLRSSLSALHTDEQIDTIIEKFIEIAGELRINLGG